MLGQRRRQWTNIKPVLGEWLVFAGLLCDNAIAPNRFILPVKLIRPLGWPFKSYGGSQYRHILHVAMEIIFHLYNLLIY